ncbi:hypothetical protein MLJ60_021795 [Escherichia coli]|nr:hypothetical protein [Escherichia coli]
MSHVNPSKTQYRLMLAIASAIPTSLNPRQAIPLLLMIVFSITEKTS